MRQHATLTRTHTGDSGTFGTLECYNTKGERLDLVTAELPWRDNARSISCIPAGIYQCEFGETGKIIRTQDHWYRVNSVPGRGGILIHVGNFAGDRAKGYATDSEGCILLGQFEDKMISAKSKHNPQDCVKGSTTSCKQLAIHFGQEPFELTIEEEYGAPDLQ